MKSAFKSIYILLFSGIFSGNIMGQTNISRDFAPPLDIPLTISSNFGELRSDAFHFGIDFKTAGTTGLNIHAIDTGYVSRIKIEAGGYGRALYITHPSGIVSVYAHLLSLNQVIGNYCKKEQYKQMQYAVDLYLKPGVLPVRRGEIVALSGNAGYSFGAHLHFEIRDERTEETLNVLHLFHFKVRDTISPLFDQLWVYPMDSISSVNSGTGAASFQILARDGHFGLLSSKSIPVGGKIAFGIQARDMLNNSANKTGIYSIEVRMNNIVYFQQVIDRLSFTDIRYVNSVLDYGRLLRSQEKINRLFLQPNNQLHIYKTVVNKGVIAIDDTLTKNIEIILKDAAMNQSVLHFSVKGIPVKPIASSLKKSTSEKFQRISYKQATTVTRPNFMLTFPVNALYDDLLFSFSTLPRQQGFYSETFEVHNIYTPLHKAAVLWLKPTGLKPRYVSKAVIVNIGKNGKISAMGGVFKDGFLQTNIKVFGKYAIQVDTVSPIVKPLFKSSKKIDFTSNSAMQFIIEDALSGIKSYRGEIDGKWALFEYDAKDHLLYYTFDNLRIGFGKEHNLQLIVTDERENKTVYQTSFFK